MPDGNGRYYFSDYVAELQARGFDGFSPADLKTYINRGYFHIARKSRWYWEETTDTFTVSPGSAFVDLWPTNAGELPNFRSLDKLYCTTPGSEGKLRVLSRDEFFEQWLPKDLTQATFRGEPRGYFVWQSKLYILPPPATARTYIAHYHQRVSLLVSDTSQPITPVHLDEAIIDAALIRAHNRANESALAQLARADLDEVFDDMRDDEEELMDELQERVTPDDSWL